MRNNFLDKFHKKGVRDSDSDPVSRGSGSSEEKKIGSGSRSRQVDKDPDPVNSDRIRNLASRLYNLLMFRLPTKLVKTERGRDRQIRPHLQVQPHHG